MNWTLISGLVDVTVNEAGNIHGFDAIQIKANGVWPNGKGPTIVLEDWAAPGYDEDDNRDTTPSDEAMKVAKLIASAPELLTALQKIAACNIPGDNGDISDADIWEAAVTSVEIARAAIAKATNN